MSKALIGYTGFVGGNLLAQQSFSACFNSANIGSIEGQSFDLLVCAGVPAAKWLANKEPARDRQVIQGLMQHLGKVAARKLILISTVDVYPCPVDVDEDSSIDSALCQPYGRHRLELEQFVLNNFDAMVVRLPGLFGRGIKKNIIFDFLNNNNIDQINPRGIFQFYYLNYLSRDIDIGLNNSIRLLNIASEPTTVNEVALICLGKPLGNTITGEGAVYDYRSRFAGLFGGRDGYMYSKEQVLSDLKSFVVSAGK